MKLFAEMCNSLTGETGLLKKCNTKAQKCDITHECEFYVVLLMSNLISGQARDVLLKAIYCFFCLDLLEVSVYFHS